MSKLDEIRERWERVTPGPWALDPAFWSPPGWGEAMHYRRVVHGEPNKISGIRQPLFSTNGAPDGSEQARQNHRDADAIAHAREDVPWLLAKIDRVEDLARRAGTGFTFPEEQIVTVSEILTALGGDE